MNNEERKEISDYVNRARSMSAEELLKSMGEMRDFIYTHMTPEGKKYFERSREAGYQK